jgi:hypothetical protein
MKVTVLLAVHNGGAFLREAVDSVLAQTFEDFELLVVDDASTDDAVEALPSDPRIRVLRNETNIGQIPSLNRGLREALGTYVARIDHDDVSLPRRLERQVALLDAEPAVALVGTWVDIISADGRVWGNLRPRIDTFAEFAAQVVTAHIFLVHPSLMFRRDAVVGVGGFDESLSAAEDQELYRRLVLARCEARIVPELLVHYRRHEGQMTYAKAAMVADADEGSHTSFLAQLAPDAPAAALRHMVRADRRFWEMPPISEDQLERFVESAGARLQLDGAGRSEIARALAERAVAAMLSGWASGAPDYRSHVRPLAAFAARHGGGRDRAAAATVPVLELSAPVGKPLARVRVGVARVLRSDLLARPRGVARSSRLLRVLYARVADTRRHES